MSAGFHAPAPGSRSGVADYAEILHRALALHGPPPVDLYHLGNNALHAAIYRQALEKPGVIVLHDAVLHHFLLGQLNRDQYITEFVYNYGEWRRPLAETLWEERAASVVDHRYFEYPLLKRIVERSLAMIVHNPGAAAQVRANVPHAAIHLIPHFFEPPVPPEPAAVARFRQSLGVGQGTTLFGIFGYLRETKRIVPCLHAFRRLHAILPDTALLVAGEAASPDLRRLLDLEAAHPAIHRLPHLSEASLLTAGSAIDCCLNLRYPAAGETSGIAMRMMGLGKPVILSAGPENAAFPPAASLQVSPGVAEAAELFDYMVMLAQFPHTARQIGSLARQHILANHSLDTVARQYRNVLAGVAAR